MAVPSLSGSGFSYQLVPLAPLPPQLDPANYDASPKKHQSEAKHLAIRAHLKCQYLLQLNDPCRTHHIEDPAITQWTYAKANVYPNFRVNPKTSLLGALFGIGPITFWWYIFKKDRDYREKLIKEGNCLLSSHEWCAVKLPTGSPLQFCFLCTVASGLFQNKCFLLRKKKG
ncbi:NADH dehydrogenase [ubiquinone] 1 beta subcomplex subunit 4-like [Eublepharis macularius]|uniref:NADH dehydrogenase [ubiquinone] 1 beta subcomplex subunit 4 n=1 Tax=Eublepharis macularius TaxID=481883 RepID=A0AA97JY41_EUBMA|nr:NADH dehydrogenase [ubiquinone] 1 beta subcomplex subunit 4-like [Eublepharis macularius]